MPYHPHALATKGINTKVVFACASCRKDIEVAIFTRDYDRWASGLHVQSCFPYLSPEIRELFISGICPTCFKGLPEEDEL